MAEATVRTELSFDEVVAHEPWASPVIALAETAEDTAIRQRAASFIGGVALGHAVEMGHEQVTEAEPMSLVTALHWAHQGDQEARQLVATNVRTDVIERTIKSGHITAVTLQTTAAGEIIQHGQTAKDIQANSLRYASDIPQMRARTEAETRNMFRIQEQYDQGKLDDYVFVVFSRAADDMSREQMDDIGFFTSTMSCAIQATTVEGGQLVTESAFVAGVSAPGQDRHDGRTIGQLGAMLGADYEGRTATEVLDAPLLVHKSMLPNGVVDVVQWYDQAAGGTFFGEDQTPQDYVAYRQQCADREAGYADSVRLITEALIAEADSITTPLQATSQLNKLSGEHMVRYALTDERIDSSVFGAEAAEQIERARQLQVRGQATEAEQYMLQAIALDMSRSCPNGSSGAPEGSANGEAGNGADEDQYGSLTFTCPKGHSNTRPRGSLIPNCKTCGVSVAC